MDPIPVCHVSCDVWWVQSTHTHGSNAAHISAFKFRSTFSVRAGKFLSMFKCRFSMRFNGNGVRTRWCAVRYPHGLSFQSVVRTSTLRRQSVPIQSLPFHVNTAQFSVTARQLKRSDVCPHKSFERIFLRTENAQSALWNVNIIHPSKRSRLAKNAVTVNRNRIVGIWRKFAFYTKSYSLLRSLFFQRCFYCFGGGFVLFCWMCVKFCRWVLSGIVPPWVPFSNGNSTVKRVASFQVIDRI